MSWTQDTARLFQVKDYLFPISLKLVCIFEIEGQEWWWRPGIVVHACNLSHLEGVGRSIVVWSQTRLKWETLSEIQTKAKKAGEVAQEVEQGSEFRL
jgi:hypothetical protein